MKLITEFLQKELGFEKEWLALANTIARVLKKREISTISSDTIDELRGLLLKSDEIPALITGRGIEKVGEFLRKLNRHNVEGLFVEMCYMVKK